MTNSNICTCPSGDGSLQHPCPMHPQSTENELKVGDPISRIYKTEHGVKYALSLVLAVEAGMGESAFIYTASDILAMSSEGISWQRGIHPSLIPEGFELVESAELKNIVDENLRLRSDYKQILIELEASKKAIAFNQNAFMEQLAKLEAARKEIEQLRALSKEYYYKMINYHADMERLKTVLNTEAAYCQKHADLLKSTDLPRSLRHQERADRLLNSIKASPKPKESK